MFINFSALNIYDKCGETKSSILRKQKVLTGDSAPSGHLRYENTCVLWLQSDQKGTVSKVDYI